MYQMTILKIYLRSLLMLIKSYHERSVIRETKRRKLLEFLRDETWSTIPIISQILGLSIPATYKTLNSFESVGIVQCYQATELQYKIWGITNQGLFEAWDSENEMPKRAPFEPSRFKALLALHEIYLQQARINALQNGWCDWRLGKHLVNVEKRPDAIVTDPNGSLVYVEFEQVVKSRQRIEKIFSIYLQKIKRGELAYVAYVCPTQLFTKRLQKLFNSIQEIPVNGARVSMTEKHRAKFKVTCLDQWPEISAKTTPNH
jgi:hypothetical protein